MSAHAKEDSAIGPWPTVSHAVLARSEPDQLVIDRIEYALGGLSDRSRAETCWASLMAGVLDRVIWSACLEKGVAAGSDEVARHLGQATLEAWAAEVAACANEPVDAATRIPAPLDLYLAFSAVIPRAGQPGCWDWRRLLASAVTHYGIFARQAAVEAQRELRNRVASATVAGVVGPGHAVSPGACGESSSCEDAQTGLGQPGSHKDIRDLEREARSVMKRLGPGQRNSDHWAWLALTGIMASRGQDMWLRHVRHDSGLDMAAAFERHLSGLLSRSLATRTMRDRADTTEVLPELRTVLGETRGAGSPDWAAVRDLALEGLMRDRLRHTHAPHNEVPVIAAAVVRSTAKLTFII